MNTTPTRRDFLTTALSTIGLTLSAPLITSILSSCESNETAPVVHGNVITVDITQYPDLLNVGGITYAQLNGLNGNLPVIITRLDDTTFVVFSSICTHQGCQIGLPDQPRGHCVCPCHFSEYDSTTGHVVKQPLSSGSATNLPTYGSTFDNATNILTITS